MNAAIIGCGYAGVMHAEALAARGVTIKSIVDPSVLAVSNFLKALPGANPDVYNDVGSFMYKTTPCDFVVVATPPQYAEDIVTPLLRVTNLKVVKEKLSNTYGSAKRIVEEPGAAERLYLCHNMEFNRSWNALRDAFNGGEFGDTAVWRFTFWSDFDPPAWQKILSEGGGVLLEQGIHIFHFASSMFGKVLDVTAAHDTWWTKENASFTAPNHTSLIAKFEKGTLLYSSVWNSAWKQNDQVSVWPNPDQKWLDAGITPNSGGSDQDFFGTKKIVRVTEMNDPGYMFEAQADNIVNWVMGREAPRVKLQDSLNAMRVVHLGAVSLGVER